MSVAGKKCLFSLCNVSRSLQIFKTVAVQKIIAISEVKQDELHKTLSWSDVIKHTKILLL